MSGKKLVLLLDAVAFFAGLAILMFTSVNDLGKSDLNEAGKMITGFSAVFGVLLAMAIWEDED